MSELVLEGEIIHVAAFVVVCSVWCLLGSSLISMLPLVSEAVRGDPFLCRWGLEEVVKCS